MRSFSGLELLRAGIVESPQQRIRALLVSKGSSCFDAPLHSWMITRRAHCVEGPNVGARESHTIMQFCLDTYDSPPAAVVFLQDDPTIGTLQRALSSPGWVGSLAQNFEQRAALRGDLRAASEPWVPQPCPCSVIREEFTIEHYGGYRPIAWWMRTFLAPFRNASSLPVKLLWPQMAQFAVPRAAITSRPREFWRLQVPPIRRDLCI